MRAHAERAPWNARARTALKQPCPWMKCLAATMEHRSQSALAGGARVPFDTCKICFTYSRVECPHLTPLLLLAALKCEAAKT